MSNEECDGVAINAATPQTEQKLYIVKGEGNTVFYFHNEAHAKKQLVNLTLRSMVRDEDDDDDDDDDDEVTTPSLEVYAKGKWSNLTRVSTTTLEMAKLSKIPAEDIIKLVDLIGVVVIK